MKVLVTGATGSVGSAIVSKLVAEGHNVRGGSRHAALPGRLPAGAVGVALDFDQPATFGPSLEGTEAVVLVAPPGDTAADVKMIPFIDQALSAGANTFVLISAMGIEFAPESTLGKVEAYLAARAPRYTFLRPTFFMQNLSTGFFAQALAYGGLRYNAAEGKVGFISADDIAAVAAEALASPAHHGQAYPLTGPEALDHHQVVAAINQAAGTAFTYTPLSDAQMRQEMLATGMPAESAEFFVNLFAGVAQGFSAAVLPTVEAITGRAPVSFAQFAQANAHHWQRMAQAKHAAA